MTIRNLKPSNCWKRKTFGAKLQKNRKKNIFQTTESMVEWLSPVLYLKINALFAAGIKLFPKPKRQKCKKRSNWKYSHPGKIQIFTFWALTKIHSYCLRILKSTGYHICLKIWMFQIDLSRKKMKFSNQTSQNEIWQFWASKGQPAQSGKVFKGLFYKEKTEALEKNGYRKHGWVVIRTDEGAGSTVGAGGKMYLLAAQEKHVSKRFDRSGYFQESG